MEPSITKTLHEIWQKCMEGKLSSGTLTDPKWEKAGLSKNPLDSALEPLLVEDLWNIANPDEPHLAGDRGLSMGRSELKTLPCGLPLVESLIKNGGFLYERH